MALVWTQTLLQKYFENCPKTIFFFRTVVLARGKTPYILAQEKTFPFFSLSFLLSIPLLLTSSRGVHPAAHQMVAGPQKPPQQKDN
jgi:hypothetical protein